MFGLRHDDRENRDTNKPIEADYALLISLSFWIVSLLDDATINGGNDYTVWCDTLVGDLKQFVSNEKFHANAHTIARKIETTKAIHQPNIKYIKWLKENE